ncbi:MAG: arginine decarboxylase, pyruvoyl-dependent [Acetobacteraceae bacterium]|nr:arginine decarboxylase, pyruvoyl-dependent [Acetobacteraceae bacterium]
MVPSPPRFTLVAGAAEGGTELNAFDAALLAAGLGNLNLIKVSSVLPPGASPAQPEALRLPPGSPVCAAYAFATSSTPGERIAAAVAVARRGDGFGVIMEWSGPGTAEEARAAAEAMAREAMARRGLVPDRVLIRAAEHTTVRLGCAFAAVALWG